MTWTHFQGCETVEDVRARFKDLAKRHHPDLGGDTETMQSINAEYQAVMERLNGRSRDTSADSSKWSWTVEEKLRDALQAIITLQGLKIEIIGIWIWVGGNTRQHKEALKRAGYKWSRSNSRWYFAPYSLSRKGKRRYRGSKSMDEKREAYGSRRVR